MMGSQVHGGRALRTWLATNIICCESVVSISAEWTENGITTKTLRGTAIHNRASAQLGRNWAIDPIPA